MEQQIETWFKELKRIWFDRDLASLPNLLSEDFQYYESPFDPPLTTLEAVQREWEVVRNQNIEKLEVIIISSSESRGMAMYHFVERKNNGSMSESRGAYWVELDDQGKAKLFRQWWMNK